MAARLDEDDEENPWYECEMESKERDLRCSSWRLKTKAVMLQISGNAWGKEERWRPRDRASLCGKVKRKSWMHNGTFSQLWLARTIVFFR